MNAPGQAPAISGTRTPPGAGQAEAPASRASATPVPVKRAHALLAASRLRTASDSRSFVDVWREAGGLKDAGSNGTSQPAVTANGGSIQAGSAEGTAGTESCRSTGPDLPTILMQHFPGLDFDMAEYVLQVSSVKCASSRRVRVCSDAASALHARQHGSDAPAK